MLGLSALLLFVMGILAGIVNAAVGSGSLLTLPVLLALGVPPGVAVRTNTIGMSFATIASVLGFRKEIAAEKRYLAPLSLTTIVCASAGSILLLLSPSSALDIVVPILIIVALALVIGQPYLTAWLNKRREADPGTQTGPVGEAYESPWLVAPMGAAAVYGGYFTAAQGVLYMGILGITTSRSMKDVNPVKNLMQLYVNATAAIVYLVAFVFFDAHVWWVGVVILAAGGMIGGYVGSHVAKRLPNSVLRATIVVVALVALVRQFV